MNAEMDANELIDALSTAALVGKLEPWQLEQIANLTATGIIETLASWFDADPNLTWRRAAGRFTLEPTLGGRYATGSGTALHRAYADAVLLARIDNALLKRDLDLNLNPRLGELPPLPEPKAGTEPSPSWERWRTIVARLPPDHPVVAELERRLSTHRTRARRRLTSHYDHVRMLPEGALVVIAAGHQPRLLWQWRKLTCPPPTSSQQHLGADLDALIHTWATPRTEGSRQSPD